jgi:ABC-type bacteriocin/lantibiotic exporter with double-glycine peptidase domain
VTLQVKQRTEYHCVLACLESILRDGGEDVTQAQIVERCPDICHQGERIEGAVDLDRLEELVQRLDLGEGIADLRDWDDINAGLKEHFPVLLVTEMPANHCMLVVGQPDANAVTVMDPVIGAMRDVSKADFADMRCHSIWIIPKK